MGEKHYDYLVENEQGMIVKASYNPRKKCYEAPGGIMGYTDTSTGERSWNIIKKLPSYVTD